MLRYSGRLRPSKQTMRQSETAATVDLVRERLKRLETVFARFRSIS